MTETSTATLAHRRLTADDLAAACRVLEASDLAVVGFVDDLYRSADGLQRPGGLYNSEAQRIDAEAIGTWVLDVYMKARIEGKTDAEARQSIADAIKGSDEWKRKHEKK